jgi:hypothetical protein
MATLLDAFQQYQRFLYEKRRKSETIRGISLSLRYLMELYGNINTKEFTASHIELFFEMMKRRKKKKKDNN